MRKDAKGRQKTLTDRQVLESAEYMRPRKSHIRPTKKKKPWTKTATEHTDVQCLLAAGLAPSKANRKYIVQHADPEIILSAVPLSTLASALADSTPAAVASEYGLQPGALLMWMGSTAERKEALSLALAAKATGVTFEVLADAALADADNYNQAVAVGKLKLAVADRLRPDEKETEARTVVHWHMPGIGGKRVPPSERVIGEEERLPAVLSVNDASL